MKKTFKFFIVLTLILLLCSSLVPVFGAQVAKAEATMIDVRNEEANINFGQYGKFNKRRTDIDLENKTIDITLTVENDYVPPAPQNRNANIVFLMDASGSMTSSMSGHTVIIDGQEYNRQEAMFLEANKLANKLLDNSSNVSIAVADFATAWKPEDQGIAENDARMVLNKFSTDKTEIDAAFDEVRADSVHTMSGSTTPRYYNKTDIEAGLEITKNFLQSNPDGKLSNATDYVILLTDGVPNTSLGHAVSSTDYMTTEQINATKAKLQELKASNIKVQSVLVDISNDDPCTASTDSAIRTKTYREVAEMVFGNSTTPTGNATYFVTNNTLVNTIERIVYESILPEDVDTVDLTDVVIKDIIPQNIVDNFDFEIISGTESKLDNSGKVIASTTKNLTPNNISGNITAEIDPDTRAITWTFAELPAQTQYTVTYRLSLKNEFDENILEIDLPTNEDVTIDYKEDDVPGDTKHDAHCPAVQLTVKRVNIIVEKIWDDGNNVDGIRPESVQIQLYADGTASGSSITLNKDNNWKYTFSGLPRLNDNGSEIKYTIVELNVPGNYTATVTGDMTKGFVVKNYHKPDEVPPTPIPQTGETSKIVIGSAMILLTGIACYSLVLSKKKQN